jgi:hypothetical protein
VAGAGFVVAPAGAGWADAAPVIPAVVSDNSKTANDIFMKRPPKIREESQSKVGSTMPG